MPSWLIGSPAAFRWNSDLSRCLMTIQFCYKRRELITLALSVATAPIWSLGRRAQPQAGMPVIGFLDTTGLLRWFDAFQKGLKRAWLRAGANNRDRATRWGTGAIAGSGRRARAIAAEGHSGVRLARGCCRQECHENYSHRLGLCHGPGRAGARREHRATGGQYHGAVEPGGAPAFQQRLSASTVLH